MRRAAMSEKMKLTQEQQAVLDGERGSRRHSF